MNLLASLGALLALVAFGVAAWGWGRMALAACRLDAQGGPAYLAVLGLAALASVGGWLNLFGLAYPPVLWLLLVAGWIEALRRAFAARASLPRVMADRRTLIPAGAVALIALALSILLLPSAAFNPFDDLMLYFPRPVRMLQAGSLGHNPFDLLGLDSLGVHAFLQAFPLLVLPVAYINAFDAVLCAVLALALVASTGRELRLGAPVILAAFAAMALTPARQVNVSSVYAISALALALAPAGRALLDPSQGQGALWRRALPLGLLLAALAGSKASTLSFLLTWGLCFLILAGATRGWGAAWRSSAAAALAGVACLLPWGALNAGNYAAWLSRRPEGVPGEGALWGLLSLRWSWAGTVPEYHVIAAIVFAAAAAAIWRSRKGPPLERLQILLLVALCVAAVAAYAASTQLPIDIHHAWRYSAPALIAAVPVAVLLGAWVCGAAGLLAALGIAALIGFLLGEPARERLRTALEYRSVLVFGRGDMPRHRVISEWGLSDETRQWMVRAQGRTRPGDGVLAFVLFPHALLFARNPVLVASPTGLTAPWLDLPPGTDAREFRDFLARYRVRYVIWHASGSFQSDEIIDQALRSPTEGERLGGRRLLWFRSSLQNLALSSAVIHAERGLIVIDLFPATAQGD
jgi:hypothetical protein